MPISRIASIAFSILIAGFLTAAQPGLADSANSLPITRVTLYTSGVGYFERGATIDGDWSSTLLFPTNQINDVLKSLVLLDTGGTDIQPVTYAAQDPANKRLQAFSVDVSDNPDRATLLNRLRGTHVSVTLSGSAAAKPLDGTITGVETATVTLPNNGGATSVSTLNLLCDDGLHAVPFANIDALQIADPSVDAELREALSVVAQGRDSSKRGVTLHFGGAGSRTVRVGYLTEAPLWQTTYRLVLGAQPRIQGWALVQNTSQDDWTNIDLSLVSGRPISFMQDMYTPIYVTRPMVQAQVAGSPTPQTYNSNMNAEQEDKTQANANGSPVEFRISSLNAVPKQSSAPPPPALSWSASSGAVIAGEPIGGAGASATATVVSDNGTRGAWSGIYGSTSASGGKLGTSLFRYHIDLPVSIPRQQSAMIPFVATSIKADAVSIYDPTVDPDHPLTGARIHNTTGLNLMGGPLTVFDEGANGVGYVGDATMDDTEPNQTRLISYAVDQAVDASSEPGAGNGTVVAVTISDGTLNATVKTVDSTAYHFKNHSSSPRSLVVEQADQGSDWKLITPSTAAEKTADTYRFDIDVPAGGAKSLTVTMEHPELQQFELVDSDEDTLLTYWKSGEVSSEVKGAIQEVLHRRHQIAGVEARIANGNAEVKSIALGQSRIRDNMKALDHGSSLYQRYVSELNDQETQLNSLQSRLDAAQTELARDQDQLDDYVLHLTLK